MEMWCHLQCLFFIKKITEIVSYVRDRPQGCIVYDDDYEGVFLKKIPTSFGISNETTFIVNEEDEYSFAASDILIKLTSPTVGADYVKAII